MKILGISAFYHDSAAALIIDGKVVVAIEEERFSRIKHDNQFPFQAIEYCLKSLGLSIADIDIVAYYEKPLLKFERLLETFVETYPFALKPFLFSIPDWIGQKIKVEHIIKNTIGFKKTIYYIPHHTSHAGAGYYTSLFQRAAILTIDGVGEYQTTALWQVKDQILTPLLSINFPHSIGLLYSTFTAYLGFKINEDEYKVMGLSAYGNPIYKTYIEKLIDIKPDGSFKLNLEYFSFQESFRMWSNKFEKLFGNPRKPNAKILKKHKDIAASIQMVIEKLYLLILNHLYNLTSEKNLCIGGGVALNALANGKVYKQTNFKRIHILGSAGDSGAAMGAALFTFYRIISQQAKHHHLPSLALGSSYSDEEIQTILDTFPVLYQRYSKENELLEKTSILLSKNNIIGWFEGRCEYGPRALGNRSILAKTSPRYMKDKVNIIKHREQFRPFAGSVLQEQIHNLFEVPEKNHASPFMNFCFQVKDNKRQELAAIVHADGSCRVQTVNNYNGRYYRLIKMYYKHTGIPCILNTSYNLRGEPIVEHPRQAIEDFIKTDIDYLVIGDFLVTKRTSN